MTRRRSEMDDYGREDIATTTARRAIAYRVIQVGWRLLDKRAQRAFMLAFDHGAHELGPRVKIDGPWHATHGPAGQPDSHHDD